MLRYIIIVPIQKRNFPLSYNDNDLNFRKWHPIVGAIFFVINMILAS